MMVWFGQLPVMVTLVPATRPGEAVPVPPLATARMPEIVDVPSATVKPAPVEPPVNVPTDVREDAVTPAAKVAPVNVPAAAVMVPEAPSETAVPLRVTLELASALFGIAVKPVPIAPEVKVPTPVSEEVTTLEASVVPVSVPAAAASEPDAAIV